MEEANEHYKAYLQGRSEMKTTVKYAIEPVIRGERRTISEMETYAKTLTPDQLITLAMAMQHLVNNIVYEIDKVK